MLPGERRVGGMRISSTLLLSHIVIFIPHPHPEKYKNYEIHSGDMHNAFIIDYPARQNP